MTSEGIAVGRSAAERIIEALADLTMSENDDAAELALEVASTGARNGAPFFFSIRFR